MVKLFLFGVLIGWLIGTEQIGNRLDKSTKEKRPVRWNGKYYHIMEYYNARPNLVRRGFIHIGRWIKRKYQSLKSPH